MSKRILSGVLCLAIGGAALVMTGCPKEEPKKADAAKAPAGDAAKK